MLWSLIVLLVIGLVAGFVARALLPGNDSMSIFHTVVLGVVGSFIGGGLGYAIFGADLDDGFVQASGLIGSVIGALIALVAYRVLVQRRPAVG